MRIFTKLFLLALVLIQTSAFAQVDVTATGGTLTASYTTLNDAFGAINLGTHTGTINIAITGNTTEPATAIPLLRSNAPSSYTSITIKPSGGNWVISSAAALTANRGVIELQGADNVTIDGDDPLTAGTRNLTFESVTAAVVSACIRISSNSTTGLDGADNITVKNVNINGARLNATATTATYGINISNWSSTSLTTGAYSNLNTVLENNNITRCYRGIYANGASVTYPNTGLIVRNNVFGSATVAAANVGNSCVYLSYTSATAGATSAIVEGNTIRSGDISISGAGFSASLSGVELAAANPGAKVRNNTLVVYQPTPSGYGAFGVNISSATTNNDIEIYNNMITVGASKYSTSATSSFIANGIRVTVAATNLKVNYNTIYVPLHTTGTVANYASHGIFISSTTATVAESRNNLIVNDNVGTGTYCMYLGAAANISAGVVNYNNYSAPSGNIGFLTAAQATLAAWKTATSQEVNSVNSPAVFVSATDLHADITSSTNLGFMTAGTPIATINTDIDGQTRSVTTPSIGADEFLIPSCAGQPSAGVLTASVNPVCIGSSSLLTATAITSTDGAGTTYQWYGSNDSITFTAISGATSKTYNYTNATGVRYFTFVNTCAVSSLADTSRITVNLNNPTYASVPYYQSFDNWISVCDNSDVPSNEWRNSPLSGNNSWRRQDQGATAGWSSATGIVTPKTGAGAANFHTYNASSGTIGTLDLYANMLVPDPIDLEFDHFNTSGTDSLFVLFSFDNGQNFTQLAAFGTATTWTRRKVSLGVVLSNQAVVRLQARSDFGVNDIGVDNLNLVFVCNAKPTAGTITAASNPICPNTAVNLSLTGGSNVGGLAYQWLTSTDGVTFTADAADTLNSYGKVLVDSTYFRTIVICTATGQADTTAILKVSMKPAIQCYCATALGGPCGSADITNVKFSNINVTSTCNTTAGSAYTSYPDTGIATTNVLRTITTNITVSTSASSITSVWIDYDQNGLFDATEWTQISTASTLATVGILIPPTALLGKTGMRVRSRLNGNTNGAINACTNFGSGETEDYIINILPAPACTNPPLPGKVVGPASVCLNDVVNLTLDSSSIGSSYQWQSSPDSITWTDVSGANTTLLNAQTILAATYYRVKVWCVDTAISQVLKINIKAANQCYCVSAASNTADTKIDSVFFSTVVAGSPASTCEVYTDNSALVGDITQLVAFNLRVRNGSCSGSHFAATMAVYIDYNQDGDFLDAGETVYTSPTTTGLNTLPVASITPPASALLGQTRMRIVFLEGSAAPASCGIPSFSYGETEDYTVNILPAPACTTPPSAGTISGPATAATYSQGQYIVTGAVGTKNWQYAFNPAGPYTQLGVTGDTINVGLNFVDTVYVRVVATSPGCPNDTTLVPFQTVASLPGNNVCDALPIAFGTNGKYRIGAANTQVGEPAPATGWLNTTLSNTMWFTFLAPASGRVSVQSPDFDTQLALWDALTCDTILKGGATLIAANDDDPNYTTNGGVIFSSYFTASCLTPGKKYYVQLDSYDTPVGTNDTTRIILTDLGAVNTSFTLDTAYCAGAPTVNLNPATAGGTFTGTGVTGTTFSPTVAGVGGPYNITYKIGVCDSTLKTTRVEAIPSATDTITNVSCNSGNNGAINVTISGTGPFTSSWSNGATTEDLTGLSAGTYTDTIRNAIGCRLVFGPRTVTQPTAITITPTQTNVLCNNGSTGKLKVAVSGGISPYTYLWSTGAIADSIDALAAGNYVVTVTDNNGCILTGSYTVTEPSALMAMVDSSMNVSCNLGANGAVYSSAMGGTTPYGFAWSNAGASASITGLAAGTYTVTITDANLCTASASATVTEPTAIAIALDSIVSPKCNGDATGSVNISTTGGTGTLAFAWSDNSSNEDLTNTTGGSYTITVTDANLCTASATYNISQPATLLLVIDSSKNVKCAGQLNGAIFTTPSGGTPAYTYAWSGSATGQNPSGLAASTYNVTLTDANGCSTTASSTTITEPTALVVTLDSTRNVKCAGQTSGGVYITVSGGTTAYGYVWSNGPTTQDLTAVVAGTYTVTVSDANGCTGTTSSTVTAPTALSLSTTKTNEIQGGAKGTASVTAIGGTSPYTYAWSNGQTTASISNLIAGTYTVTVTDANGCTSSSSAVVSFVSGIGNVDLVNLYEVFPNPTTGKFAIEVKLTESTDVNIQIVSSTGQLVKVITAEGVKENTFEVNQDLAAGLYFVRLSFGDTQITKRLSVVR